MPKFVLMYEGEGPSLADAIRAVSTRTGIHLVEALGENLIVEGNSIDVRDLTSHLPGWRSVAAGKIRHPDNRVHVKRS